MSKCKHSHPSYSKAHDAQFCHPCNKWLSSKCKMIKGMECSLCMGRPRRPIEGKKP